MAEEYVYSISQCSKNSPPDLPSVIIRPPAFVVIGITFHSENVKRRLNRKKTIKAWFEKIIHTEGKAVGQIAFIFCSDQFLLKMNRRHLGHDYYTDVITFNYCESNIVSGDIFISVDRVRDNAKKLGLRLEDELHRVMLHGVLHLLGFNDKSNAEKKAMRNKENYWLAKLYLPVR